MRKMSMNKLIRAALSALLCAVGLTLPTFAVAEIQPLTPDGNLEIVDDIVHEDKQFITVKSRSGAEFSESGRRCGPLRAFRGGFLRKLFMQGEMHCWRG